MPFFKVKEQFHKLQWFSGKKGKDGFGPQDHVMSILPEGNIPIVKYVNKGKATWHQYSHTTPEHLLRLLKRNHALFEILVPSRLFKVYFDIDDKLGLLSRADIKERILKQFPGANINICGYEVENKHSYHITLSNYTLRFEDRWKLQAFCMANEDLGFDATVYSTNRQMKCINQSKPLKHAGVYMEGSTKLSKHLIQYDFDEECIDINTLTFPDIVKAKANAKGPKSQRPDFVADIPVLKPVKRDPDFFFYDATPLEILNNIPHDDNENKISHNVIWRIMVWARKQGISFDDFMAWNNQKNKSDEPVNARIARYWGYWSDLDNSPYNVATSFIEAIYSKFWPSALKSKALRKFRESTRVKATLTVPRQYLQGCDVDESKKFNVLATGMGSNKTGCVVDFIEAHPESRVLWVTPRITLAYNTHGRLLEFQHYKMVKNKKAMDDAQRLICSPCSLHYIQKPYEYIIVDESETMLQMYLTDKLHVVKSRNNFVGNLLALQTLISESKLCVFMDAFITRLTMDFISAVYKPTKIDEKLCGHIHVVRNTLPEDYEPRIMSKLTTQKVGGEEIKDEEYLKMNILNDLTQGKKLYVFIPRKVSNNSIWSVQSFGEYLARQFKWTIGKEIKLYHGDRPAHEFKELIDPDSVWSREEVRVVIANTKITVGVNFSLRNVFDKVYARYEDWVSPRDFFQAIYRVRHPKDNEIVYTSTRAVKNGLTPRLKPIDVAEVRDMHAAIIKNAQLELDMNESAASASVFEVFRKMACITIRAGPEYFYELNPALKAIEEGGELTFLWKNIKEVEQEVVEHHFDTEDDEPSWEKWLGIRKFVFRNHYKKYLQEDEMEGLWDYRGEEFFDQCAKFYNVEKDHVLHKVITHNNIKVGEDEKFPVTARIPENMRLMLSRDFRQVAQLQSLNATTIMKMFNVYFGKRVLEQDKKHPRVRIGESVCPNIDWTEVGNDLFRLYHLYATAVADEKENKANSSFVLELSDDEDDE